MSNERVLMEAKGITGQLELLESKIRIKRQGFSNIILHGLKGDKEIFIKDITSIQFKRAGKFTNGYIQFAFMGGRESKGGIFDAVQDENTVMFKESQQPSFEGIKEAVERRRGEAAKNEYRQSYLDDLERLAELRKKGIITEEEFNTAKRRILGI